MGYAANRDRPANPNIIRGVVVWTDGNWYVVRDITGWDVLLYTDSATVWHDNIGQGDRVIAYTGPTGPSSTAHVDFVA
jgi:hypothetical protein